MDGITVPLPREKWIWSFAAEWVLLADGRADFEELLFQGRTLHPVVGDKSPAEVAQLHFKNSPEPEQLVRDPKSFFTQAAVDAGLIMLGDPLDQDQMAFGHEIAELCAAAIDHRPVDAEVRPGDYIRALFGSTEQRQ